MLKYEVIGNNVISVDLQNDHEIVGIAKWNKETRNYTVNFMIKGTDIDVWDSINNDKTENITMESDIKSINRDMTKYITALFEDEFFKYYINRYDYMMNCFDRGNELFEKERLANK